ncbi:MAG TPA: helix-turn-helix domain-containing protein [Halothiobacillus sp.]|nr:helix-turn-helix domain-containing protein [Halothiobacillus sp.]
MIKPLTEQGQALDTPPNYQPPADPIQDISTASQCRRLLAALIEAGADGVTTVQARRDLNVMQPAPRIKELREQGYKIATFRQPVLDDYGRKHPGIGRYVLLATPDQQGGGSHAI